MKWLTPARVSCTLCSTTSAEISFKFAIRVGNEERSCWMSNIVKIITPSEPNRTLAYGCIPHLVSGMILGTTIRKLRDEALHRQPRFFLHFRGASRKPMDGTPGIFRFPGIHQKRTADWNGPECGATDCRSQSASAIGPHPAIAP